MGKYKLRFMMDYGSGTCFWSDNEAARLKFGYPVMPSDLPVSDGLKAELERFILWYDESLNWDDPGGDSLWSDDMWQHFREVRKVIYHRVCEELGDEYDVRFKG